MSLLKTKKENNFLGVQRDFQRDLEDYYTVAAHLNYSNSTLVWMLYLNPDSRVRRSVLNGEALIFFDSPLSSISTTIPLSDFKYHRHEIKNSDNALRDILDFFAKCEVEIIKDIRSTWFPISVITENIPTEILRTKMEYFYLHCPKTFVPYKATKKGDGLVLELKYLVIGYFGD